ncbi:MAG: nuclear transport factor 2 family protein [Pseudomonadota bacterium]
MTTNSGLHRQTAEKYAACFTHLRPETVADLRDVTTSDIRFTDPFTQITGQDDLCAYLGKMFVEAENPRFIVTHIALDRDLAFLRWQFSARIPVLGDWQFTGMSEIGFNDDGSKVTSHIDHWDASQVFYARIPVLGWFIRRLARRLGSLQKTA